jgi:nucleoside phosphorylase
LIEKYQPYLVFNVGMVYSFSSQLRQGDIFIAERYYFSDVDFSSLKGTHFGQIPSLPAFYVADSALNEEAEHDSYLTSDRYVNAAISFLAIISSISKDRSRVWSPNVIFRSGFNGL